MNHAYLLSVAALLMTAPLSWAHTDGGLAGPPKTYCEDPSEWDVHDYGPTTGFMLPPQWDGNLQDCDGDTVPVDYDGHSEWVSGGAWLLAEDGDGVTGGSLACWGAVADHVAFPWVRVVDTGFGSAASFRVFTDTRSSIPPTDPSAPVCGDFEEDQSVDCVGSCVPTFPPGLDGAYYVVAQGTFGHVTA